MPLPRLTALLPIHTVVRNVGKKGFYVLWTFVCMTAFFVVSTALQANSRTFHAFSRDNGLPDRGLFQRLAKNKVPVPAVWLICLVCGPSPSQTASGRVQATHALRAQAASACSPLRVTSPSTPSSRSARALLLSRSRLLQSHRANPSVTACLFSQHCA